MENIEEGKGRKILINGSRQVYAAPGISLLQALKENDIFLSSACGGHGICGLCRVHVPEGADSAFTPAELAHLSPAEQQDNIRLACQVKLSRDLRISIPEKFFHIREYRAVVSSVRSLTGSIREVVLELVKPETINFKSGQYIQLRIPPYPGKRRMVYRAYSIASAPSDGRHVELEIGYARNGLATTFIFEHLKTGQVMSFNGPHGDFRLSDGGRDMVMIAGGSGLAPMKSMLCDMRDRNITRKVRLFFGARSPAEIFHADLMASLERTLPDFKFIPTVAAKNPEEKWKGEIGLVTGVLDRRLEDNFNGEAYLCGSPAMIEACLEILRRKKIPEERIFYDKFA